MLNRKRMKRSIIMLLVLMLSISMIVPVFAQGQAQANPNANRIHFANSYVEFSEVYLAPRAGEHVVTFKMTFHNGEARTLSLQDYFLKLQSASGEKFTVKRLSPPPQNQNVAPGTSVEQHYYAEVKSINRLQDLTFIFSRWNFSMPDFEQKLGQLVIKETDFKTVPAGQVGEFKVGKLTLGIKADRLVVRQKANKDETDVTLHVSVTNLSQETISFPSLNFEVITSEGWRYPLALVDLPNDAIRPRQTLQLMLRGDVSTLAEPNNWTLYISRPMMTQEQTPINEPLALYRIPAIDINASTALSESHTYTNDNGTYHFTIDQIYRLPWEDQDMITADIRVKNNTNRPLPLPNIEGVYTLDKNIEIAGQTIMIDQVIGLQPGAEILLHVIGKIPYTYQFSTIDLELREIEQTATGPKKTHILDFQHNNQFSTITNVKAGNTYTFERTGRTFDVKVNEVNTYTSSNSDLYAITLSFVNKEQRLTELPNMIAQLELQNGVIYPLQITVPQNKTNPNMSALVELSTVLPKGTDTKGANILIGEAIFSPMETGQVAVDSYVQPVTFDLPVENTVVKSDLKDITFAPYTLTLSDIKTPYIYYNEVTFKFDYELKKDTSIDVNTNNAQIFLEVEDANGKVWLERTFAVENHAAGAQNLLELGNHSIEFKDMLDILSINRNEYKVNIYVQLPSQHKKLLASQTFKWGR